MLKQISAVSVAVLGISLSAFASNSSATDWNLSYGGWVSWNGMSNGTLTGSGISVSSVSGTSFPMSIYGGSLSFTSGAFTGSFGSWNSSGSWSWGAGTITVTGCIQGVTASNCSWSNDNTVLFTDSFSSISISSSGELILGQNTGVYNSSVAAYFGVPTSFTDTSSDFLNVGWGKPGSAINGSNMGGTFADTPAVAVPEDWSVSLTLGFFAFALAAFGIARRFGLLRPVKS